MPDITPTETQNAFGNPYDYNDVRDWFAGQLSSILAIPKHQIADDAEITSLGLDSSAIVSLTGMLEDRYQIVLSPSVIYDYPKMSQFCSFVAEEVAKAQ